ncbi:hypothetical protein G7K_5372-t1 [Saitoella complicata NRRL Y-17804]|uniref:CAP-Gly domain-containing protein n=2 Tax=Saitoella complicata (strain BCRC 22490 / CBS 7301 / JCM 7358 / NBRC 10748 / NRRL Y-17804) TaxID=698492 RepID=A0A0E9NNI6_SAICN|nr:hypothetical protein G7K_5372-t1 [Saitoella complicata NRRL Y-17804]
MNTPTRTLPPRSRQSLLPSGIASPSSTARTQTLSKLNTNPTSRLAFNGAASPSRIASPGGARSPSRAASPRKLAPGTPSAGTSLDDISIGETVEVMGDEGPVRGVIRWIGEVDGKPGMFVGVEALEGFKGKNSGDVAGKVYFKTKPGMGIFTKKVTRVPPKMASLSAEATTPSRGPLRTKSALSSSSSTTTASTSVTRKALGVSSPATGPKKPMARTPTAVRSPAPTAKAPSGVENVAALKREIANLKEQMTTAKEFEGQLAQLEALLQEKAAEVKQLKIERDARTEELSRMANEFTELQGFIVSQAQPTSTGAERSAELDELRRQLREREERLERLSRERETLRQDFRTTIDALNQSSDETTRVYEAEIAKLSELLHQSPDEQIQNYVARIHELERLYEESRMAVEDSAQADVMEDLRSLEEMTRELETGLNEATEQIEIWRNRATEAEGQVAALKAVLESAQHHISEMEDEIRALRAAGAERTGAPGELEAPGRKNSLDDLTDDHPQKRQAVAFLEDEVARLKEELEAAKASSGGEPKADEAPANAEIEQELSSLRETVTELASKTEAAEKLAAQLQAQIEEYQQREQQQTEKTTEGVVEFEKLREELAQERAQREQLHQHIDELTQMAEDAVMQQEDVIAENERLRAMVEGREGAYDGIDEGAYGEEAQNQIKCEICGGGHDALDCAAVFSGDAQPMVNEEGVPWCENCEKYDHATENCENADEVF